MKVAAMELGREGVTDVCWFVDPDDVLGAFTLCDTRSRFSGHALGV